MTRPLRAAAIASVFLFGDALLPPVPPPARIPAASGQGEAALRGLPSRTSGRGSRPGDPLNMIFAGTENGIRAALKAAGWTELPISYTESIRAGIRDLLLGRKLERFPPMTIYYVLGRPQDMNWAKVITPVLRRHHFRLWRTGLKDGSGREIWWGTGNYDLSVRWTDLSHRPDPEMNAERDYVRHSLDGIPGVESLKLIQLPQIPLRGINECGYEFRTDGRALLVELASPGP